MINIKSGNILNCTENIIIHQEIWKDIKGYEGLYKISNFGRVKSLERYSSKYFNNLTKRINAKKIKGKILTSKKGKYLFVMLSKNGKYKTKSIHRLVAEAFIDNPNNYNCVNHIDGNKYNNSINNLEWCSVSQNNIHAYRNGLNKRNKKVLQYDMNGNFVKEWNSVRQVGKELGISFTQIGACARGELKKAHNYIWKYEEDINDKNKKTAIF